MSRAYEGLEPYIFISYSHKDQEEVKQYIKALQKRGFRIWYDGGIEAGTEWPEYIATHLAKCKCVMAFISSNFAESYNCRQELNFAQNQKKDVLSVYIEGANLPFGLQMQLGLYQALYKTNYQSSESFIESLCDAKLIQDCKEEPQVETKVERKPELEVEEKQEPEIVENAVIETDSKVVVEVEPNEDSKNSGTISISDEELQQKENEKFKIITDNILSLLNTKLDYVHKVDIWNHLAKSIRSITFTPLEVFQVLEKLVSENKIIVQKMNTYAIFDLKERIEKQRTVQRDILKAKLAEEEKNYTKTFDTLQKKLHEQEEIFKVTKGQFWGAGAKAKKEAKQAIEYYRVQIQTLKSRYMFKKISLQNELENL